MRTAPRSTSSSPTVDFPDPIPPVSPTASTTPTGRAASRADRLVDEGVEGPRRRGLPGQLAGAAQRALAQAGPQGAGRRARLRSAWAKRAAGAAAVPSTGGERPRPGRSPRPRRRRRDRRCATPPPASRSAAASLIGHAPPLASRALGRAASTQARRYRSRTRRRPCARGARASPRRRRRAGAPRGGPARSPRRRSRPAGRGRVPRTAQRVDEEVEALHRDQRPTATTRG